MVDEDLADSILREINQKKKDSVAQSMPRTWSMSSGASMGIQQPRGSLDKRETIALINTSARDHISDLQMRIRSQSRDD